MLPPCAASTCWAIASPSPWPSTLFGLERKKGRKIDARSAAAIPGPQSSTSRCAHCASRCSTIPTFPLPPWRIALRTTFSSALHSRSGSPCTRIGPGASTLMRGASGPASKRASAAIWSASSVRSSCSRRARVVEASSRESVSSSPTSLSMRMLSRSMRSSEEPIRSGCWCASPTAACSRASGERSSCETSCSRRRWPSIRAARRALMRSKSRPRSLSSSPARPGLAKRGARSPREAASKALRKARIGREKYQASRAANSRLARVAATMPATWPTRRPGPGPRGASPGWPWCAAATPAPGSGAPRNWRRTKAV